MADPTQTNISQTTIPDYAKPYVETLLGKAEAVTDISKNPYKAYPGERTALFTDLQNKAFTGASNLGPASQLTDATSMAQKAGLGALGVSYGAGQYGNQYGYNPQQVSAQQYNAPSMQAAQSVYGPSLQNFQMGPAQQVGTQSFVQPGAASAYMNPYMQNVVDIQQREARRASDIAGQQQQAQAVQSGAFGGSRDAIMRAERQRNLATQLGDIQATGSNAAYNQAMQQFNAEQQARMQAQMANQQAGLTTGSQNLQALLGVQGLGAQYGTQMALANLSNQQQAAVQNQAAQLQTQGMNAQQALQAALANQQAGLTSAQAGAQYGQAANQLNEQSRQFGAGLGLQGLQTGLQAAGALGNLGATQFGQQAQTIGLQGQAGGTQQQQQQNILNQQYQDFLNQKQYPYQQLSYMSDMLRGLPLSQTATSVYSNPNLLTQAAGIGFTGAALKNAGLFGAKGGLPEDFERKERPAGLAELAIYNMA